MSVSLDLLDDLGAFRVSLLRRLLKSRATIADIFSDVIEPNGWHVSRRRADKDCKKFVRLGFASLVMLDKRRKAYEITELGKEKLRTALSFYQSV